MCLERAVTKQRGLAAHSAVVAYYIVGHRITAAYVSYLHGSLAVAQAWIHTNVHTGTYVTQTKTEKNRYFASSSPASPGSVPMRTRVFGLNGNRPRGYRYRIFSSHL